MNTSSLMASLLPFNQTKSKTSFPKTLNMPKPTFLRFNKRFFLSSYSAMELVSSLSSTKQGMPSSSMYDKFFPCCTEELIWPFLGDYHRPITQNPEVEFPYVEQKPEYGSNVSRVKPLPIEKGKGLDVISLLSTGGSDNLVRIGAKERNCVKAESLRSKYILVCCAFVPSLWHEDQAWDLRRLSLLLSELLQSPKGCDFEMVMVAKMRKNWENDKHVFDHFFSAFSGCLAVPFEDKYRRDYICKSLKFNGDDISVILVDIEQKVLQVNFGWMFHCGANGFPFTDQQLKLFKDEWLNPWERSPDCWSLAGLLCCQSSNLFSSNIIYKFNSDEVISVEQLNKKLVGLYLCRVGDKFRAFLDVYEQCRVKNLELEILVVCMPYGTSMDPKAFENNVVKRAMEEFKVSWWVFPYQNSACIRLSNLFFASAYDEDALIIVGPNNEFVDEQGGEVALRFGVDAHPFTVKALVQTYFERLNAVTLESLLTYGSVDYVYRCYNCDGDGKKVPLAELQGKNVLVIYTCPIFLQENIHLIDEWFPDPDSDFETVYVPAIYSYGDFVSNPDDHPLPEDFCAKARECFSKMKCLVRPFDPKHAEFLYNHDAFLNRSDNDMPVKGLREEYAIAFGKDGYIHTLNAIPFLKDHGGPFLHGRKNLVDQIIIALEDEFDFKVLSIIENLFDVRLD